MNTLEQHPHQDIATRGQTVADPTQPCETYRQSEEIYRSLVEHSLQGLVIYQGKQIAFANPALTTITGYAVDELMAFPPGELATLVHEDDREGLRAAIAHLLEGTVPSLHHELRMIRKDGALRWLEMVATTITYQGNPALQCIILDISRRKQAEEMVSLQHHLALSLSATNDLGAGLNLVLKTVLQLEGIDGGGIYLVDPQTGNLYLAAYQEIPACCIASFPCLDHTLLPPCRTEHRQPAACGNGGPPCPCLHLRASTIIPIVHDGQTIATLNLISRCCNEIPGTTRMTLEAIATQIGGTIARISAETALRESQRNFQTLFNSIGDFLFVVDQDGRVIHANAAVEQQMGYTLDELCGKTVLDMHPPAYRQEAMEVFTALITGEQSLCTIPLITRHGRYIPVETRVARGLWNGMDVFVGISRDVSERMRVERALGESERKFRSIVEQSTDGISLIDERGFLIEWNPQMEQMTGLKRANVVGQPATDVLYSMIPDEQKSPALYQGYQWSVQTAITTGSAPWLNHLQEQYVQNPDGKRWYAQQQAFVIKAGTGFLICSIVRDITSSKRMEEALRQARDTLEQRVQERTRALLRSNEALQAEMSERQQIEESYRLLVETSLQGLALVQEDRIILTNPAMAEITGYSMDELLASTSADIRHRVHPDDRERIWTYLQNRLSGKPTPSRYELRMVRKNGEIRWVEAAVSRMYYQGQPASQVAYVDITERKQAEEFLTFQARLLDAIGQAVIATTPEGTVTYWNRAAEQLYGWRADEVLNRNILEVTPTEATTNQAANTMSQLRAGQSWSGEFLVRHRSGRVFPIQVVDVPLYDEQGTLAGIIGISTDITERKQAEQALAESEARYRTLVETSPGAILLTDMDGTIHFCNQQAARLFGYATPNELYTLNSADLISPRYLAGESLSHIERILQAGDLRNIEYSMRRSDGSEFPAEINSSIVTDTLGYSTALIIVVHDIRTRKQTEEALRASYEQLTDLNAHLSRNRNLLQALFDGLEDGLLLLDQHGTIQAINRTMATLLGSTSLELLGRKWADIHAQIVPDVPGVLNTPFSSSGKNAYHRVRYQLADGSIRILDVQIIALYDQEHHIEQQITHVVDVTEMVQLQARVIENERLAASGRLAASVAHEINTPLQAIQTSLGLVRKIGVDADRNRFLANIEEEIVRVGQIVHQLLDLYRPGATRYGPVDLAVLIKRILLLIGSRIREQGVTVFYEQAPDLPPVQGHAHELVQVVLNLVINALEAMPNGGTLRMKVYQHDTAAIALEIHDTGCGISTELQERMFEPFVTTRDEGTGLGLAISHQIVVQHGGRINVTSEPGIGSVFCIVLPLTVRGNNR